MLLGARGHIMINLLLPIRKSVFLICFTLVASGCTGAAIREFDNRATLSNPDKVLAFVGRKIRINEFDPAEGAPEPSDEDFEEEIMYLDVGFKARYRILELVHGDFEGDIVDFKVYDHYGFPEFAKRDIALIYLTEYDGALYHSKYQYDEVYPTRDSRYAGCGDPYQNLVNAEELDHRPLQEIRFSPQVVFRISDFLTSEEENDYLSQDEIKAINDEVNAWLSAPAFKLEGDRATCKMGVYTDELFRIKNETILLPRQRYYSCFRQLQPIEGLSPTDSEWDESLQACVEEKKRKGLP